MAGRAFLALDGWMGHVSKLESFGVSLSFVGCSERLLPLLLLFIMAVVVTGWMDGGRGIMDVREMPNGRM